MSLYAPEVTYTSVFCSQSGTQVAGKFSSRCRVPTRVPVSREAVPGKSTGVGSLFLLQGIFQTRGSSPSLLHLLHWQAASLPLNLLGSPETVNSLPLNVSQQLSSDLFLSNCVCESESHRSCLTLCDPMDYMQSWNSPGQNSGVGGLSLLQGICPTQGWNPVSRIAGRFFTSWATRETFWEGGCLQMTDHWKPGFCLPGLPVRRAGNEVVPLTAPTPLP